MSGPTRREFTEGLLGLSIGIVAAGPLALGPAIAGQSGASRRRQPPTFLVTGAPFYARGDGRGDDTPRIQAAIDAAAAAGGGVVLLPAGTFLLQSVSQQPGVRYFLLDLPSGVILRGAGWSQTLLRAGGGLPDQTRIISTRSTDGASLVTDPAFEDFTLDGNAAAQLDAASCVGISCVDTVGARHLRVRVQDVKGLGDAEGTAFDSYRSAASSYDSCEAIRTGSGPTGSGFSATLSSGVGYRDCRASGSTHWQGFTTYLSTGVLYQGCHGYQNAQRGLNCEQSQGVTYSGCRAGGAGLGNSGDGFYLFRSTGITLDACSSAGNRAGVRNVESHGVRLLGGSFEDSVQGQDEARTGP